MSILSGAHRSLVERILANLRSRGLEGVPLFVGGVIPDRDVDTLLAMGVAEVFGPETPTGEAARVLAARLTALRGERGDRFGAGCNSRSGPG